MIRTATHDDIPRLVEMGAAFHDASGQPFSYNEDATELLLKSMIDLPTATVIRSDNGLIGGMLNPAYCDPSWIMAVELFWWATDKQGVKLLSAFEEWAKSQGAHEVRMTTLEDMPGADKIMARRGYKATEISYQRVI